MVLVPGAKTDLAARAYAQTAPAGDEILYVHTTITNTMRTSNFSRDTHAVSERWQQGDRWRMVVDFDGRRYQERRGADGVLRFSGGVRPDALALHDYIERRSQGFIAEFRASYERGTLDESGTATFAGRTAKRYVTSDEHTRAEYFVDAETGMPLGSIERFDVLSPAPGRLQGQGPNGTFTATTVVDSLQRLAPTPAAQAALAG